MQATYHRVHIANEWHEATVGRPLTCYAVHLIAEQHGGCTGTVGIEGAKPCTTNLPRTSYGAHFVNDEHHGRQSSRSDL